jgi:hypothetical protein
VERDAEVLASARASARLWSLLCTDGIAMPATFSAPSASTASVATSAESMPPDSPSTTFAKPNLRT